MSDRTSTARLKNLARDAINKHKTVERALKPFVTAVSAERQLLRFLLLPYLQSEYESRGDAQSRISSNGQCVDSSAARTYTRSGHVVRSPSQFQLTISRDIKNKVGLTILDTYRIDGKAIGDYTVREALGFGRQLTRDGFILMNLTRVVANPDLDAKLRDVVKVKEAQRIIKEAVEVADAA